MVWVRKARGTKRYLLETKSPCELVTKGDRNTVLFHATCAERRRKNRIGRMKKDDGVCVEDEEEKRNYIAN